MDPNQPAFPVPGMPPVGTGDPRDGMAGGCEPQPGLTIRAEFAKAAMQGLLAAEQEGNAFTDIYKVSDGRYVSASCTLEKELVSTRHQSLAKEAVACADALIAELNKTK